MDKLLDLYDRFDECYDAYEAIMYLAGVSDSDSRNIADVLRPLNRDLKRVIEDFDEYRKRSGLTVVR